MELYFSNGYAKLKFGWVKARKLRQTSRRQEEDRPTGDAIGNLKRSVTLVRDADQPRGMAEARW